jgi:hypothetical protein
MRLGRRSLRISERDGYRATRLPISGESTIHGRNSMKYLCLICAEKVMEQMPPADADKHFEEYREFTDSIRRSGHLIGCNRLLPPVAASTVRVRNGRVSVTDGPFAETKEQLAGFYLVDAADLDEALRLAAKIPPARVGSIEVRPIRELPGRRRPPGAV